MGLKKTKHDIDFTVCLWSGERGGVETYATKLTNPVLNYVGGKNRQEWKSDERGSCWGVKYVYRFVTKKERRSWFIKLISWNKSCKKIIIIIILHKENVIYNTYSTCIYKCVENFPTIRSNQFEIERNVFLRYSIRRCISWKLARIKWKWHFAIFGRHVWWVRFICNSPTQSHNCGKNKTAQFRFTWFPAAYNFFLFAHFSILRDAATYMHKTSIAVS